MNERIKELRKHLGLTQQEFADKLGVKRGTVANYELIRNEPSNSVVSLICREFNVNETWLRTGEGDMFVQLSRNEEISLFMGSVLTGEKDEFKRRLISALSKLDESQWEALEALALNLADEIEKD